MYVLVQLVTSLMALSDLLQGCSNKSDTVMINKNVTRLTTQVVTILLHIMTVSDLLEQPCNKSDDINEVVTTVNEYCNCSKLVDN
jgi:hypothetical protein